MNETNEIKLRKLFYEALYNYFEDNLPSHLYPTQRIQSVTHDLLDLILDAYEDFERDNN
jgi:hypothetical protein